MHRVYFASYPTEKYDPSPVMAGLEDKYVVLHPSYNWEKAPDQINELIKSKSLIPDSPGWKSAIQRDMVGLKICDILVYDVDTEPGYHFIMAAYLLGIPVVAVSNLLTSISPYFASLP